MTWPIGSGSDFAGIVTRDDSQVALFSKTAHGGATKVDVKTMALADLGASGRVDSDIMAQVEHDLELLAIAGNPFSHQQFLEGDVTPVFFGSALTNFGVESFLDAFVRLAPSPSARAADGDNGAELAIDPIERPFSAYVFKLQANMNPKHRDSTAFLRVCSGRFERDMVVKHHRLGRDVRLSRPHSLVAQERSTVEEAFPGDIIGIINPGVFAIGDTISVTGGFAFKPLPQFQPEIFARIRPTDVGKRKAFDKGMEQMAQEGTVQIMRSLNDLESLVAAVGRLQFDVLQYRLRHEGVCRAFGNRPDLIGDLDVLRQIEIVAAVLQGQLGNGRIAKVGQARDDRIDRMRAQISGDCFPFLHVEHGRCDAGKPKVFH